MKNKMLILVLLFVFLVVGCNKNNEIEETPILENEEVEKEEKDPNIGKNRVDFYLFYSSTCGHCHNERRWIETIREEFPYVDFHMYEVSEEEELFIKVLDAYGIEDSSVPVTIIGNDYFVGYSETKNRKFIRYIEELSKKENCGVVETIIQNGDVEACMEINK